MIEELKALRLQPGETLVIQCDRILTPEQREWMRSAVDAAGIKALVLDGGLTCAAIQSDK